MDSDGRQLSIKQPSRRVVLKWEQRLNNEEVYDDVTIDLTALDPLGADNPVRIVDPTLSQIEVTLDLSSEKSGDVVSIVPVQTNRATVKEVVAGLLALTLIAYFLVTGLPSGFLPMVGGILGYYFGSRSTFLRN